ncbi:phosphoribosylanthranilate isomerase [Salinicoccus luteus]|uniref:phosphoribosylanthranilate isomerase n=1 Tax=Salinicoccus luteus TaxID=367840 RepID=UPI0004E24D56|nr:phosphoribosylanthranilate isomerase [Salinicoccus luteus]
MKIKICGIQSVEAARWAVEAGVDMIGLMFADSRRKIGVAEAREIVRAVGQDIDCTGVFVNEPIDEVRRIYEAVGLDFVQLHGDESRDYAEALDIPVIKAFSIRQTDIREMFRYSADYILIDSPPGKYRGGTGHTFDWSALDHPGVDQSRLILAGGINSGNVRQAYEAVSPAYVDISSGVETDGVKDRKKIFELTEQMKGVHINETDLHSAE